MPTPPTPATSDVEESLEVRQQRVAMKVIRDEIAKAVQRNRDMIATLEVKVVVDAIESVSKPKG